MRNVNTVLCAGPGNLREFRPAFNGHGVYCLYVSGVCCYGLRYDTKQCRKLPRKCTENVQKMYKKCTKIVIVLSLAHCIQARWTTVTVPRS